MQTFRFCGNRGKISKQEHKFCVDCGTPLADNNEDSIVSSPSFSTLSHIPKGKPPTLHQFLEQKKEERTSCFGAKDRVNLKKNLKTKGNGVDDKPVHINVAITTLQEGDTLKLLCGKAFSIDFPKTATSKEILERSFTKHACHNSDDIDITFSSFYELFYPDGVIVSRLRETNEPFVLYQYEKEVGRSYNRINFLYLKEDQLLWKDANAHGKYTTKRCQDTYELSDGNSIPCGERNYSQLNAASIRSTTTLQNVKHYRDVWQMRHVTLQRTMMQWKYYHP